MVLIFQVLNGHSRDKRPNQREVNQQTSGELGTTEAISSELL